MKCWIKFLKCAIEANSYVFSMPRWMTFLRHPLLCIEMANQFKKWEEFFNKKEVRKMKNQKTSDTPDRPQNPILQLIELSPNLPREVATDVANRIADWVNSGETLLTSYVTNQIAYAKEAAQAYPKELSPLQRSCWCKDCTYAETSEDEGKPYCICNNNKSNNWQELMDVYSSCQHCELREGQYNVI